MLNMKLQPVKDSVFTISEITSYIKSKFNFTIDNETGSFQKTLEFYSIPKITDVCSAPYIHVASLNIPDYIILADPMFFKPSKIDILLRGEIFFNLLEMDRLERNEGRLILFYTVFLFCYERLR